MREIWGLTKPVSLKMKSQTQGLFESAKQVTAIHHGPIAGQRGLPAHTGRLNFT